MRVLAALILVLLLAIPAAATTSVTRSYIGGTVRAPADPLVVCAASFGGACFPTLGKTQVYVSVDPDGGLLTPAGLFQVAMFAHDSTGKVLSGDVACLRHGQSYYFSYNGAASEIRVSVGEFVPAPLATLLCPGTGAGSGTITVTYP